MNEFGAALALDAIIGNADRHDQNILLQPVDKKHAGGSPRLHVWFIDHENSWLAQPRLLANLMDGGQVLKPPLCKKQPRNLPVEKLRPKALAAAKVAESMSRASLILLAQEAATASGVKSGVVDVVTDVLSERCRHASQIVKHYMSALEEHCS